MSKSCEKCRRRIHSAGGMSSVILRQDPATGFTCRFCSEDCAKAWSEQRAGVVSAAASLGPPPADSTVSSDPASSHRVL